MNGDATEVPAGDPVKQQANKKVVWSRSCANCKAHNQQQAPTDPFLQLLGVCAMWNVLQLLFCVYCELGVIRI